MRFFKIILLITLSLCASLLSVQSVANESRKMDSIKNLIKQADNATLLSNYYSLSAEYQDQNNDSAICYLKDRLESIISDDDKEYITFFLGNIFFQQEKYDSAIFYFSNVINDFSEEGREDQLIELYNIMALSYSNLGNIESAVRNYSSALNVANEVNDTSGMFIALTNLAALQLDFEDYSSALELSLESLNLIQNYNQPYYFLVIYTNICELYQKVDSVELADKYYNLAINQNQQLNDIEIYSHLDIFKSRILMSKDSVSEAEKYLLLSEKEREKLNNNYLLTEIYYELGKYYNKTNRLSESERYLNRALAKSRLIKERLYEIKILNELSIIYRKKGDEELSNLIKLAYYSKKDSFDIVNSNRLVASLTVEHKLDLIDQMHEYELKEAELVLKREKTIRNVFIIGALFLFIIAFLIYRSSRIKTRSNKLLSERNDIISKQQKELTDSIQYASRIQNAILPSNEIITDNIPESFVMFKPKDIVSGDFYWFKQIDHLTIIAAVDCTGHGVPGAFMSMLGIAFLNEIVRNKNVRSANEVLDALKREVKSTLRQEGKENEAKDGMDMALCVIDYEKMELQYAGAYNPLYLIRKNELIEIKADKMPIGFHFAEKASFTNHVVKLQKNDCFYILSDGYADQIGGPKGKKFMTKNLKRYLHEIHHKPMNEQKFLLESTLDDWIRSSQCDELSEQIDDILIIGFKI